MSAQTPAVLIRGRGIVESVVVLLPLLLSVLLVALVMPPGHVGALAVVCALVAPAVAAAVLLRRRPLGVSLPDVITLGRVVLTGVVAAATVLVLDGHLLARTWGLAAVVGLALLLDAVDGYVARRTRAVSPQGARLDMESDAALLLVLSVLAIPTLGWWVLAIGAMRYVFVLASWVRPALRAELGASQPRRVVAALQGIALLVVLVPAVPLPLATAVAAVALVLLAASFLRDVVDLERRA